jgi:hypothetical protein
VGKVTHSQAFKDFVSMNGFCLTLGDFLSSKWAAEYRKECTLLRHEGWMVEVEIDRSSPGANVYRFFPPVQTESGIQRCLA